MADAGYDVADYRDIDPVFGTLADAEALIAEAHELGIRVDRRHRAQPLLRRSTRGSRRRSAAAPGSPSADRFFFRAGRGRRRRAAAERLAVDLRRPGLDPDAEPGRHPASGTCTCSRPSSPTSTGTTRRCARSSRTSCGSGSTAASTASGSTRAALLVKDPALPDVDRGRRRRAPHPYCGPRRGPRDLPGLAARSPTPTPAAGRCRRGLGARRRAARPLPAPRRAAHRVQLRLPRLPLGRRRAARGRSTTTLAAHAPGRRAGDLGAVQPRRRPARHPVRPRPTPRSTLRPPARPARRPTSRSAPAGPGPRRC